MPIKDKGMNAFIGNWAGKVLPMDFWVGLRAQTTYRKYDPSSPIPIIEKVVNGVFSYSDGTIFDVTKGDSFKFTSLTGHVHFERPVHQTVHTD